MKTPEQRIADLERKIAQLERELLRKPAREAAPLAARRGWFLGITREDFTQGVDEFFEIDVWIWSETLQKWRKVPGFVIEARDWFLNDGEEVEKETKVKVEWYETTWVVTAMYCSPTDIEEFQSIRSPGGQDGEQEGQAISIGNGNGGEGSSSYGPDSFAREDEPDFAFNPGY